MRGQVKPSSLIEQSHTPLFRLTMHAYGNWEIWLVFETTCTLSVCVCRCAVTGGAVLCVAPRGWELRL